MPHTTDYVVVGNHLAQSDHLSYMARGLGLYIQSLPAGTGIDIKSLASKAKEGEISVAAALRDLEAAGYLKRTRVRLPDGRIVTETYSYNHPAALRLLNENPDPDPDLDPDPDGPPAPEPETRPEPEPQGEVVSAPAPAPTVPASASHGTTARLPHGPAAELLAGLRVEDPRLLLSVRDVERLAPAVDAWFATGATPEAVIRTLTAALPATLQRPAGLLAHRLTTLLPPPVPARPRAAAPHPIQFCVTCDETAFRAPQPGQCPDCVALASEHAA
ncbi:helix-turn-helix domain-containing protein [Streptomyces sp. NPDC050842]|uniref:helix-turn-helix domain-containing protein n=1 Tax=Streptomyces sp. NPDC050842 TaxID=3365636 RepID=UPI0037984049